jgi:hypothetical protein
MIARPGRATSGPAIPARPASPGQPQRRPGVAVGSPFEPQRRPDVVVGTATPGLRRGQISVKSSNFGTTLLFRHGCRTVGCRDDRGVAALELLVIAPVILMLILLVIAAGRTSLAQGAVDAAARAAARQASIAPTVGAAQQAADAGAAAALRADGLDCQPTVTLPGLDRAFGTQPGQQAQVHARVVCAVRTSDLTLVPGLPGSIGLKASFTSPLDPFRSRDLGNG